MKKRMGVILSLLFATITTCALASCGRSKWEYSKKDASEFIELIKKSDIFFLVYDVKDDKSAGNIYYWIEVISQMKDDINKDLIYILANKNDKGDENKNIKLIEKGRQIAEINNAKFKAISAKDNEGIDKIIEESVDEYLAKS